MSNDNILIQFKIKLMNEDLARAAVLAKQMLIGRDCILLRGRKYKGRKARIDSVIINHHWKEGPRVEVLPMIYSLRPNQSFGEFLNSDTETRSYRSLADVEIL